MWQQPPGRIPTVEADLVPSLLPTASAFVAGPPTSAAVNGELRQVASAEPQVASAEPLRSDRPPSSDQVPDARFPVIEPGEALVLCGEAGVLPGQAPPKDFDFYTLAVCNGAFIEQSATKASVRDDARALPAFADTMRRRGTTRVEQMCMLGLDEVKVLVKPRSIKFIGMLERLLNHTFAKTAQSGKERKPSGGDHVKLGHKVYPKARANPGYQASQLATILEGVKSVLLEGIARNDAGYPDLRLTDDMWKTLKIRLWALAHLMGEFFPNVGDFLDAAERKQFATFLDAEAAKQPLFSKALRTIERKWDGTNGVLVGFWENAREQGLKGILLDAHHTNLFCNVLDRGHPVRKAGEDEPSSVRVGPDYIDRLTQTLLSSSPLLASPHLLSDSLEGG